MERNNIGIMNGFTDSSGRSYNIKQAIYEPGNNNDHLKFITQSTSMLYDSYSFDDACDDGIILYQSKINPKQGYRIYRSLMSLGFDKIRDAKLIETLQKRQQNIKLTEFPTGVVTFKNGNVIGQLIPFYENAPTIYQFSMNNKNRGKNPFKLYKAVLDSIKELYDNGIYYRDNHGKNFVIVDEEKNKIKTIDFDPSRISFDYCLDCVKQDIFNNFLLMVNLANENLKINKEVGNFIYVDNFESCKEQLEEMNYKLKQKGQ